jgi:predicted membrane protein
MNIIATLYAVMDKRPLRALSLVMALLLAGCIFWDPSRFAAKTSELKSGTASSYVGGVRRCDPRRGLSSESRSLAGIFAR